MDCFRETVKALAKDMDKLIAVVRGAFLKARPHISLSDLGIFVISVIFPDRRGMEWKVLAEHSEKRVITVFRVDETTKVSYQDPWEFGYD
ncbi:hypothetical protein QFC20_006794 [Naganishia adeliensis]|uniref:Uncharacterized protein n=1 Tax=Naganishia adeliensis TaxID=92952 RepID=A0ACC2V699_9TREE|nr:hypothetical protein QFC20_006794 [Naganishia adeliensis]